MTTFNNDSLKNELASEFIRRNDFMLRWGLTISSFVAIPGLVGFWPMNSVQISTGNAYDLGGQGRILTYNGNPTYNIYNSFASYVDLDGTGDYLSRTDEAGLSILGTETVYASSARGLTMGGWFWNDGAGVVDGLIGKWTESGNQRSYLLLTVTNVFRLAISSNGSTQTELSHTSTFSTGQWYFVVGRVTPSTEMSVFMNGVQVQTTTSIPASIFDSTADFQIGAYNAGTQNLDGRASLCFLSANALSNSLIQSLFQQSRILFQV